MMRIGTMTSLVAALLLGLGAAPAQGQAGELEDGRWLPYLGCWVETEATATDGPMTCVVPEGSGVAFLTVSDAEVTDRRVLRGDGAERPTEVAGCTGVEAATFSSDGHRLYTTADLDCGGAERRTAGLIAMVDARQWIEARALGTGEGSVAWVKRYGPAPATRIEAAGLADRVDIETPRAVEVARVAASAPITVDAVIEAHARTDAEAVRSWLAEQGDPLRLDADALVRLADAGVPPEVIDVAIAVSFPDRFQVARQPRDEGGDRYGYDRWDRRMWSRFGPRYYDPFYYDPFYSPYSRYNRYYGYGGFYGTGYTGYGPTVVVVRPVDQTSSGGRAVPGRGYTQGSSGGTSNRSAVPRDASTWSPPSSAVRGTSSAGVRAGQGYTGGSSSSSSSKGKAKRRGSGSVESGGGGG